MTPERYEQIRQAFLAVRLRPIADRVAALDALCAGDAQWRAEVESLLAHDAATGETLTSPLD